MKHPTVRVLPALIQSVLFAALLLPGIVGRAAPLGTAFTYQGRLTDGATAANGSYSLTFALFDDRSGGSQIGDTVTNASVVITNGVFTAELDFGAKPFDGGALWLEIGVRPAVNIDPHDTLVPRQPVTPVPYALRAVNATTALSAEAATLATNATTANTATTAGAVPWTGITARPGGLDDGDDDTLYSNGNGLALAGTQFSLDTLFTDGLYWKLGGNAGTTAGVNFLGTTDEQALELKVNSTRVLRLEPHATSPNLVGGSSHNTVAAGAYGATIGGGGWVDNPNEVSANYGTVGGGRGNRIRGNAEYTTIAGGRYNLISTNADSATIGGGYLNQIGTNNTYGTVAGGYRNSIGGGARSATISGGTGNEIQATNAYGTIAGGNGNILYMNSSYGTISGGQKNYIQSNNGHATISGGTNNVIQNDADFGTISGGGLNLIQTNADYATIGGGWSNVIQTANNYGTIGGGAGQVIEYNTLGSTIAGGYSNIIRYDTDWSTIGGGYYNIISTNADSSIIGGGALNTISLNNSFSTIAGGYNNDIRSNNFGGTISGGINNRIATNADYATIPGGYAGMAESHGQMVHANGSFSLLGDAQSSVYVLRRTTTNAVTTELFLDGISQRMKVPSESTWTFDILVVGRGTAANVSCGFRITGVVENNAGTLVFVLNPGPSVTAFGEDNAATTATVAADSVNDALSVRVAGIAGVTMRWVATVHTVQVKF